MRSHTYFLRTLQLLLGAAVALGLAACYPGSLDTIAEADLVAVNHDKEYFANNNPSTYFMPDTVGVITEASEEAQLTREEMDFILNEVASNFSAISFTRLDEIDEDNLPDVVVTVSALTVDVVGGGCVPWYPWWGWYPWYPGWGWGPGYCYPSYIYSYSTGTLAIDMINPETSTPERIDRVWHAGLNGLLRSSVEGNRTFVADGIAKAFDLSPYLSSN